MCSNIIASCVHTLTYKWRKNINISKGYGTTAGMLWGDFLESRKERLDEIIGKLFHPTYTMKAYSRGISEGIFDATPPDFGVCKRMLYPNDEIILVKAIIKPEIRKYGYIIISACGSILTKFGNEIEIQKYGANQYADEVVRLIKSTHHMETLPEWLELIEDMDSMQLNVILFHNIFEKDLKKIFGSTPIGV